VERAQVNDSIGRDEGRHLFGRSPGAYERARPGYPAQVFDVLRERCALGPGCRVVEVGPGPGLATRELLAAGASVVAIEPDAALAGHLQSTVTDPGLEVRVATFEDATLPTGAFDLVAAATSFHWVEPDVGPAKAYELLRPGGWCALWWNVFGDPGLPDAFHDATYPVLGPLPGSPPAGTDALPYALDRAARLADLELAGFRDLEVDRADWRLVLTSAEVRALYATYSNIQRLPSADRERVLDDVARIAADDFGDRVVRRMVTMLYTGHTNPTP
jgi:hypothetical protein